ncbi:nuclear transport factor 2 family protein [Sphingobium aromaticivastans]|uniref:nuclear transport factor 2 family protein n=1 Tax=Sphingobium aromaticivastans TaxID=1778665 RepID=UPI003019CD58
MDIMPEAGDVAVIGSSVVEIEADIDQVWQTLTDFRLYGEWNPLCHGISVEGPIGGFVRMEVQDDLKSALVTLDYRLDAFDVGRRIAWSADFPAIGLSARRDQYLQPLDAGRCVYWTTDLYTGPNAREQAVANGAWVRSAFDGMALALKARSEGEGAIGAADALAIQQVIGLYAEALDDRDLSLFDRCLAADVVLHLVDQTFSLEAYRALCQRAADTLSATQHQLGPSRLWRDAAAPHRIQARTSFIATHVHPADPARPVTVGGVYRDRLERRAEGWRIVERVGDMLWRTGDEKLLDFASTTANRGW